MERGKEVSVSIVNKIQDKLPRWIVHRVCVLGRPGERILMVSPTDRGPIFLMRLYKPPHCRVMIGDHEFLGERPLRDLVPQILQHYLRCASPRTLH